MRPIPNLGESFINLIEKKAEIIESVPNRIKDFIDLDSLVQQRAESIRDDVKGFTHLDDCSGALTYLSSFSTCYSNHQEAGTPEGIHHFRS